MNIKQLTTTIGVFALLVLPAVSSAATYLYVGTDGDLHSMEASSATEALATAPNLAVNSGVQLVDSDTKVTPTKPVVSLTSSFYQYINTSGNLQSVSATSASVAMATATNIAMNSGVILVTDKTKLTN